MMLRNNVTRRFAARQDEITPQDVVFSMIGIPDGNFVLRVTTVSIIAPGGPKTRVRIPIERRSILVEETNGSLVGGHLCRS